MWSYNDKEKKLISSFIKKGKKEQEKNKEFAIIDLNSFLRLFSKDEVEIIEKYSAINPKEIGYKLQFIGTKENTSDFVSIENQSFVNADKEKNSDTLPICATGNL